MSTFIIAEAGVNHNGSTETACELVRIAAQSGADAVKFQTFSAVSLVRAGTRTAAYQSRNTGEADQFELLRKLELSQEAHHAIVEACEKHGIEFMSTPFDEASADFLLTLGMRRIKIPSGEITNLPLLRFLAAKDRPLILSTGMSTLSEVLTAVDTIRLGRDRAGLSPLPDGFLTVLHCTSNYPAAPADVHLRAMATINSACGLPIGYSDHTEGIAVSLAAVALGATVIEKHFTLERTLPGPDHAASLEPGQLTELVRGIRAVEAALGQPEKAPSAAELPVRSLVRRSIVSARDIAKGATLQRADLVLLRPGTGIEPCHLDALPGRRSIRMIAAGTTLQWNDLEPDP